MTRHDYRPVLIHVAPNPAQAQFVKNILEGAGIEVEFRNEFLWTARGGVPLTGDTMPELWVDAGDAEIASRIVRDVPDEEGAPWTCPSCGESSESQFSACWKCGRQRPTRRLDTHYVDPRLVALYDRDNPRGPDTDFFVALADEANARTVVDLGCGTGTLTIELATDGRRVLGIDPSPAMLSVARAKPGAERVEWMVGDASAIGTPDADFAVMSGNVAQVFVGDDEWTDTLHALARALRPGGILTFESRNPDDRAWEGWNREATYERFDAPNGPMECWLEVTSVADDVVRFEGHNVFLSSGEDVVVTSELRFRSAPQIVASLSAAGFEIVDLYGDWDRSHLELSSRLIIVVARRSPSEH